MHRRAFLITLGGGLGGCTGDSGPSVPGSSSGEQTEDRSTAGATPTPLEAEDVLSVERRGTVTHEPDAEGTAQQFAEVHVENKWDKTIGKVTIFAEWLGPSGTVEATTRQWLYTFEPGAVWEALVPAEEGSSSDDVAVAVEVSLQTVAEGPLSAADHEMTVLDGAVAVTGTVTNESKKDVFPTVFGKFFDDGGTIVGGATAPLNNVPAEDSAQFELSFPFERTSRSAPVDYELVLDIPDGEGCLC